VHGWKEQTSVGLFDFLRKMHEMGIRQVSVTDIERDGELSGPALALYRDIVQEFPEIQLVASGGISSVADLEALKAIGCDGAIVGKAFFEDKIPMQYFRVYSKT
jgi:phosphoribosylformimino-5-aminoimidazole carboxamide ribotide isomerase